MAHVLASLIVGILTTLFCWSSAAGAEESVRQVSIEAEFPQRGDYMCAGFDSLWMMSDEKLLRIALADNAITEIPLKGAIGRWRRTVAGEGAIWVADNVGQTIYKIDPKTNTIVMAIPAAFPIDNEAAGEIAVGDGAVWAITGTGYEQVMRRFSAQTGAQLAEIPLPSPSADRGVVFDFGSVWVAGSRNVEVYRIDPGTDKIIATIELQSRPVAMASGEGSVWVRELGGTVQRIDGNSGRLVATLATDAVDRSGEIVVGDGFVWINSQTVPLAKIDPRTNAQRSRFEIPGGVWAGYTIAYDGGFLWLGGSGVFRIKPPG